MKAPNDRYHHGDLRSALLEAATELIQEQGVAKLSLRECARRVGVSHAAPYRHFADKDALLLAIAKAGLDGVEVAGRAAIEGIDDPHEQHDTYGVIYVKFAVENPELFRVMFTTSLSPARSGEPDWATASGAFGLLMDITIAMLDVNEDPVFAAFASWSLVHGLAMMMVDGRVPPDRIDTPEKLEGFVRAAMTHWRTIGG